ncbi:hypothetical protein ACF3OC_12605 [Sphingobacterium cellulitidis]|uniref:hypothetical protein n=1 Tax=Sphingobacterium cellulitidis TaxID=1768011 RepID=UPI00370DA362
MMRTLKYLSFTALFAISLLGSSEAGTILPSSHKKYLLNESYLSSSIEYRLDYINFMTWDDKLTDFYKLQNPIYFTIREGVITLSNSYSKTRVFKIINKENTDMGVKYDTESGTVISLLATADGIMFFLESDVSGVAFMGNRIK